MNHSQLDRIEQEVKIEVSKPEQDGTEEALLVRISIQRTLVFVREGSSVAAQPAGACRLEDSLMIL